MSVFHSTSFVRCLLLIACGVVGNALRSPQIHRLDRCAELSGPRGIDRLAIAIETAQATGSIEDGEPSVRIFVPANRRFDVVVAVQLRRDLQEEAVPAHAWRSFWMHSTSSSGWPAS
jgi:hypothetical protein